MKKKLLSLLLLLTLVLTVGCNKEEPPTNTDPSAAPTQEASTPENEPTATSTPAPTSTPTPTPTPLPENLAKVNLEKLTASYDTMLANQPDYVMNAENGMGCDMNMEISVSEQLMELIGLSDIKSLSLDASLDYKDTFAGELALTLNEDKLIDLSVMTDFNNVFFNLPKYSSQYAGATMAELLESEEELPFDMSQFPSNAEVYDMLRSYVTRFVDCFKPQTEITKNVTIGTGDYIITGDKYTVTASKADLLALFEEFEAEFSFDSENITMDTEITTPDESTFNNFFLNYYEGADGSYAWEILTDSPDAEPVVFVSSETGICLYGLTDGTPEIVLYSLADSETEGTLYILGEVENPDGTTEKDTIGEFDYEIDEKEFALEGYIDTMELSMEYSTKGDVIDLEYEFTVEGVTMTMTETINKNHLEAELTLASYGMKLGTITMTADYRDCKAVSAPANSVDMETWTAGLDMEAFATDLNNLMTKYPALQTLFAPEEEDPSDDSWNEDWGEYEEEPFVLPENYTDDFMGMTGYAIDTDGYIDFTPLESEVFAAGKPSTGFYSVALTDTQKLSLIGLCASLFEDCYSDIENYYSIWGSADWGVDSYYHTEYYYSDNHDNNSFIFLNFDAVSGDFIDVRIYTGSAEKSIQAANDALAILGVTGTVTAEDLTMGVIVGDFVVYSYEDDACYGVTIEAYEEY